MLISDSTTGSTNVRTWLSGPSDGDNAPKMFNTNCPTMVAPQAAQSSGPGDVMVASGKAATLVRNPIATEIFAMMEGALSVPKESLIAETTPPTMLQRPPNMPTSAPVAACMSLEG